MVEILVSFWEYPFSGATVDGRNPKQPPGMVKNHPWWCRILSINSMLVSGTVDLLFLLLPYKTSLLREQHHQPGFVLPYMQRGELGTPTKIPQQLETCEFWSPTKMERKRFDPWRLTPGTCPHGGLFSDHFPNKNGWFVGYMLIFQGVGESSKIWMWMGETSAIFCGLKRGWEIRCV